MAHSLVIKLSRVTKTSHLGGPATHRLGPLLGDSVHLEDKYPQRFRSFRLLTNHPLYVAKAATSLTHILEQVGQAKTPEHLPNPVKKWLRQLATDSDTSDIVAFRALRKTTACPTLPKLRDAMSRLIQTLAECWEQERDGSYEAIARAARGLVDECARASALEHRQLLPAYLPATPHPELDDQARVDGKRMTLERVLHALRDGMTSTASLTGSPEGRPIPGQGRSDLLLAKLNAGGFSITACNSAEDLRDKAEYLAIASIKKIGREKGLQRYDHMRLSRSK